MTDISFCDRRLSGTPVHSAITAAICFLSTCGETSNRSLCRASSSAVRCARRCTGETVSAVSSGCSLSASSAGTAPVLSCSDSDSGCVSSTVSASGNGAASSSATPSNCWRSAIISRTSVCCWCQAASSSSSAVSVSSYCTSTSVIREVSVRSPMRSSRSSWRISASCWWLRVVSAEICFGGDDRLMATRAQAVSSTSIALSGN